MGQLHAAGAEQLPADAQQRGGGLQEARAAKVHRDEAADSGADGPDEAGGWSAGGGGGGGGERPVAAPSCLPLVHVPARPVHWCNRHHTAMVEAIIMQRWLGSTRDRLGEYGQAWNGSRRRDIADTW